MCSEFILSQAIDELEELRYAESRLQDCVVSTDSEVAKELADVLGVLFHFAIRMGYTPETLSRTMLAKFKERFSQ